MQNYLIAEISGKQYKIEPKKSVTVDYQGDIIGESIEGKVLLSVTDGKVKIGKPFVDEKLKLKVLETKKAEKIRVSKFHAKANYRRSTGSRAKLSVVSLT